jgi:hypothetical protein
MMVKSEMSVYDWEGARIGMTKLCFQRKAIISFLAFGGTIVAGLMALPTAGADDTAPVLQPYVAPDQSASAGLPAGWQVTKAEHGVIQVSGPHGEQIGLGEGIFVKNGPLGAAVSPPIKASMPAQATLGQKYMMLWRQATAADGEPVPQIKILSARRIPINNAIGECAVVLGSMTSRRGAEKFETQICSLRPDSGGVFKLVWNHATIPDALAKQERATVEAVLHSYRPSQETLKLIMQPLTPVMPSPPSGVRGAGGGGNYWGQIGADHAAECMDLGVIREEPIEHQPSYCH